MKNKYSVPKSAITEKGLKALIKKAAKEKDSVGEWARENGITPQAVSSFFRKTQSAGIKLPAVLGYRPQVIYLPLDEPLITAELPKRPAVKVVEVPEKKKKGKKS